MGSSESSSGNEPQRMRVDVPLPAEVKDKILRISKQRTPLRIFPFYLRDIADEALTDWLKTHEGELAEGVHKR